MNWELMGTVLVAVAGLGATVVTAALGRRHADRLAAANHRRERAERIRQDRLGLYLDALAHAVDQERKLDAIWASDGERAYNITPQAPGAPLVLASRDEIAVRMRLLADEDVERAWTTFVEAWTDLHWWAETDRSGDPAERAPEKFEVPLRAAIAGLKSACRGSLESDGLAGSAR